MIRLSELRNETRSSSKVQRVGRGPGSKRGKTSCRGVKGDKSRSGYKRRRPQEGGQLPLFRKLPTRGFAHGRFIKPSVSINLSLIESLFNEGDVVNMETLREKGLAPRSAPGGLKILSHGELTKKVTIEANRFSEQAIKKLEANSISYKKLV